MTPADSQERIAAMNDLIDEYGRAERNLGSVNFTAYNRQDDERFARARDESRERLLSRLRELESAQAARPGAVFNRAPEERCGDLTGQALIDLVSNRVWHYEQAVGIEECEVNLLGVAAYHLATRGHPGAVIDAVLDAADDALARLTSSRGQRCMTR